MAIRFIGRPNLQAQYDRLKAEACPRNNYSDNHILRTLEMKIKILDWIRFRPHAFWYCDACGKIEIRMED